MYAKDLIEILQKLPEDTIICRTSGEDGGEVFNSVKYFPQYNILYLEPYWTRKFQGFLDMAVFNGRSRCSFYRDELRTIRDLARDGKKFVDELKDGKMHRIQVVQTFAVCEDMCNDFAVKVDEKYIGGQRGEGVKSVICDFEWESLGSEDKEEEGLC